MVDHGIAERVEDGSLRATDYGREFSDWHLQESARLRPGGGGGNPPFTAYGKDARPGSLVSAIVRGVELARATVGADGFWMMQIPEGARVPRDGDVIHFYYNGVPTTAIETWRAGGAPDHVADGVTLVGATG